DSEIPAARGNGSPSSGPSSGPATSCATSRAAEPAHARSVREAARNQNRKCAWRLDEMENGQVVISKRGIERIRRGHLWVYRSDVLKNKDAQPGGIVAVCDERGAVLGKAFFSSKSQISIRLLSRGEAVSADKKIDDQF